MTPRVIGESVESEVYWRLGFFFTVMVVIAIWETTRPKRTWQLSRLSRWANHLTLSLINTVIVRLFIPLTVAGYAFSLESAGIGMLNWLSLPYLPAVVCGVILLDLAIYAQHYLFHKIDFFWRFHRMHHTDLDFDVTTGIRFHPIEIVISLLIKIAVVTALGPPVVAVIAFEVLLNATSMFNHGNIALPQQFDRMLRMIIVTPDMHRVHHSVIRNETDSNFGFNLSWWDCIFGTYKSQPDKGHQDMKIGLPIFRQDMENRVDRLISQPFRTVQE